MKCITSTPTMQQYKPFSTKINTYNITSEINDMQAKTGVIINQRCLIGLFGCEME
jgi:hypothetical protein